MKIRFTRLLQMMSFAACLFLLPACGGDKDDEPDRPDKPDTPSTTLVTDYGKATPTGEVYTLLWASSKDGNTELNIPGFPTMMIRMSYNYYPYIKSINEKVEFHSASQTYGDWTNETSISGGSKLYARIPVKGTSKEDPEYVYAYLESFETLNNPEHYRAGVRMMYESPVIPTYDK